MTCPKAVALLTDPITTKMILSQVDINMGQAAWHLDCMRDQFANLVDKECDLRAASKILRDSIDILRYWSEYDG